MKINTFVLELLLINLTIKIQSKEILFLKDKKIIILLYYLVLIQIIYFHIFQDEYKKRPIKRRVITKKENGSKRRYHI